MMPSTAPGRFFLRVTLGWLFAIHAPAAAPATDVARYPERPLRLLVGFAQGGVTDTTARLIGQRLTTLLGQPVVIDNRPGDAGNVAARMLAMSAADGHTLLMGTVAALAINPTLFGRLPYDPVRDFAPITQTVNSSNVLVVNSGVPVHGVKALIALARANPGKVSYGSSGVGGASHLAGALFGVLAGARMVHVPYKGSGPDMAALIGGQVQCVFASSAGAVETIRSGKIRALGVTTIKRAGMLPEIPTIAEQGLKGYDASNWQGLLAPAKTPRPIVTRLNAEVVKILNEPGIRQSLFDLGLDPAPTTPTEFGAYVRSELIKWARIVRTAESSSQ